MRDDFKIGDVVICISGYVNKHGIDNINIYGGLGYEEDKVFTISNITGTAAVGILWPADGSNGVYSHAVKKYSDRKVRIHSLKL